MDRQLEEAKRVWRTTGNKIPVLTRLLRSGQEKFLDQLIAVWDEDAVFVKYGLSLREMEEESDHIESICGCINCTTIEQFIKKMKEVGLFIQFRDLVRNKFDEMLPEEVLGRTDKVFNEYSVFAIVWSADYANRYEVVKALRGKLWESL